MIGWVFGFLAFLSKPACSHLVIVNNNVYSRCAQMCAN